MTPSPSPAPFEPCFGQAADAYSAYHPAYPPQLFERILAALPRDHLDRAMDLGAGTGRSTFALLPYFAEVIAVERDARMAEKIRESDPRVIVRITRHSLVRRSFGMFLRAWRATVRSSACGPRMHSKKSRRNAQRFYSHSKENCLRSQLEAISRRSAGMPH